MNSFVELTHYLLELPKVSGHYLLSERFHKILLRITSAVKELVVVTIKNPQFCNALEIHSLYGFKEVMHSSRKRRLFQDSEIIDVTPLPKRKSKTPPQKALIIHLVVQSFNII